ncbi:hypothetical protein GX411_01655 [Candidatus Fermentibacteria bacterium]|nr:hypothetical protein [Candidatus Fermentibacteria bacterium]
MKRCFTAALLASIAAAAAAGTVVIENSTGGWDIIHVYIAAFGARTWGADRLEDSVLADGDAWSLRVPSGIYSIRLVDEDGDTYTRMSVPVMDTLRWEVTLEDLDGSIPSTGVSSG